MKITNCEKCDKDLKRGMYYRVGPLSLCTSCGHDLERRIKEVMEEFIQKPAVIENVIYIGTEEG